MKKTKKIHRVHPKLPPILAGTGTTRTMLVSLHRIGTAMILRRTGTTTLASVASMTYTSKKAQILSRRYSINKAFALSSANPLLDKDDAK
jgi:hypothetical protein